MKNTLQTIALLFLISLTSCEKETNQINEGSPRAPFSNKMYTVDELPNDIKEYYYQIKGQDPTKFGQKTESATAAVFSENSIVGNTDLQNNSNYSIGYVFEDTPKHIIYNLVINKDSNGNIVGKRFKYICNPSDYDNFKLHNFDFKYFVGITEVVTVPSNSNSKSDNGYPPCIDGTPCIRIIPSAPTGSLGGSGSSSYNGYNTTVLGYNTSAGTGNYSVTFGGTTYYSGGGSNSGSNGGATGGGSLDCTNHDFCIPDSYGGYNYSCGELIPAHHHEKNATTAAEDPCDPCANNPLPSGIVPINLAPYYLQNIKAVIPLTKGQWVYLANNDAVVDQLWHVIDFRPAALTPEYKQFVINFVQNLIDNPSLNLDFDASSKSPMNIDFSSINNTTPEGKKFNVVYDALKTSPEFKSLFIDLFQNNNRINVEFKIGSLNNGANGNTSVIIGGFPLCNTITISPAFLNSANKMEIAKTILHECIHAFLNIKLYDTGQGAAVSTLNSEQLFNLINQQYNGFSGNQDQHNFIYNYMLPTMVTILSQVKDILVTPEENTTMSGLTMHIPLGSIGTRFDWQDFYHNLALSGLQSCQFFQNEIGALNPTIAINQSLMDAYNQYNYYGHLYLHP